MFRDCSAFIKKKIRTEYGAVIGISIDYAVHISAVGSFKNREGANFIRSSFTASVPFPMAAKSGPPVPP